MPTPVSPERRIVLSDVNRRGVMLPMKFSDEVIDFEIDWTEVSSGDPVSEVEVTAKNIAVEGNATDDNVTRIRVSGGDPVMAVLDLLAITADGERIGARLKLPVTFRASAPGPVTRLLSGALTGSGAFAGLLTNAAPGTVSLTGQVAGSGSFTGSMSVTVVRALSGALMASSSLTGSLTVSEGSTVSLVGTVAATVAFAGALTNSPVPTFTLTTTEGQTFEGIGMELQSDSIEGDGGGIQNSNTTSLPLGLTESERTRFATEIMSVNGQPFVDTRLAMGLYYRGISADGKEFRERIPGQNAAMAAAFQLSGVGINYVHWSPAPYWKKNTVSGVTYQGSTYPVPTDSTELNTYMRRLYQGGTLDHPVKASDPTGYAAWMEAFATSIVNSMEYVHTNIYRIVKFTLQNEPIYSATYPSCQYNDTQMYDVLKVLIPKIRASAVLSEWEGQPNRVSIYMDSMNGQSGIGVGLVKNDPALITEIDGWAWHKITECANDANWPRYNSTTLMANRVGKPVFTDESEYFDNQVDAFSADRRFANTAMMPMGWFKTLDSRIWYWIHIGKNSNGPAKERQGRALTSWRPVGAGAATEDPSMPEGHFTPVNVNWNAVKPWVQHLIPGSVRIDLTETFDADFQGMAWRKPDGKHVIMIVNRTASARQAVIEVAGKSFSGLRYTLAARDVPLSSQEDVITVTMPAWSADFWTEDGPDTNNLVGAVAGSGAFTGALSQTGLQQLSGTIAGSGSFAGALTNTSGAYTDTFPVTSGIIFDMNPDNPSKVAVTGSLIDSIAGSNGSTYAATGTGSARPTLATVGSNKLARFAGSHELIVDAALATAMSGDPAYTMVVVGSCTNPGTGTQYFFDTGKSTTTSDRDRISLLSTTGNTRHRRCGASTFQDMQTPAAMASGMHLMVAPSNGGGDIMRLVYDGSSLTFATAVAGGTGFTTATVGNRKSSSGNAFLGGDIGRIVIFNRALTTGEMASIRTWAQAKYGTP